MTTTQVLFLRTWCCYSMGDVADMPADIAASLIEAGYCIRVMNKPQWETR